MNMSAQCRQGPSSTCLPSIRTRLAVARQRAVGDDQVQGVGLAAAGLAAEQHVPLGQVDVDLVAVLVDAQVDRAEHGQREHRHGGGVVVVVMRWPPSGAGQGAGSPRA